MIKTQLPRFSGIYYVNRVRYEDKIHNLVTEANVQDDLVINGTVRGMQRVKPPNANPVGRAFNILMKAHLREDARRNSLRDLFTVIPDTLLVRDYCRMATVLPPKDRTKRFINGDSLEAMYIFEPSGTDLVPATVSDPRLVHNEQVFIADDALGNHASQIKTLVDDYRKQELAIARAYQKEHHLDPEMDEDDLIAEVNDAEDAPEGLEALYDRTLEALRKVFQDTKPSRLEVTLQQEPEQPPEAVFDIKALD